LQKMLPSYTVYEKKFNRYWVVMWNIMVYGVGYYYDYLFSVYMINEILWVMASTKISEINYTIKASP